MNILQRILYFIRTSFFSGLLVVLPIALTITLIHFFLRIIKNSLAPIHNALPHQLQTIPYFEVILGFILIFAIGIIVRFFFLGWIIRSFDVVIQRIPVIQIIYTGIKQMVHSFIGQDKLITQEVVFVEFPSKGMYSLGFVSSKLATQIAPTILTQDYVMVFVPTTPNPTTGFFIAIPRKDAITVDLTRAEAMALIISGGIIQPERFIKQ